MALDQFRKRSVGPWPSIRRALLVLVVLAASAIGAGAEVSIRVNNIIQVAPTNSAVCQDLRDVLATLTDASSENRYLIRLEPGLFSCGMTTLFVPKWVAIEGAGTRLTTISGQIDNSLLGVVHLVDQTELRKLKVVNVSPIVSQGGIVVSTWVFAGSLSTLLDDVTLRCNAISGPNRFSIYAVGGDHVVDRSNLGAVSLDGGQARFQYSRLGTITQSAGTLAKCFYCFSGAPLGTDCQ